MDELEEAIYYHRLKILAAQIENQGLHTQVDITSPKSLDGYKMRYILVFSPIPELKNEFATRWEARHLIDFLANLSPEEAFRRWAPTVEPFDPPPPYTDKDAERDARAEVARLKEQYKNGEMDLEMLNIMARAARQGW